MYLLNQITLMLITDHCINCYLNTVFPRYYNLSILHPHQNEDVLEKHEWKKGQKIRMRIQQKYLEQLLLSKYTEEFSISKKDHQISSDISLSD